MLYKKLLRVLSDVVGTSVSYLQCHTYMRVEVPVYDNIMVVYNHWTGTVEWNDGMERWNRNFSKKACIVYED